MGRGHTDRAQRAELPIRHPPGGDVGRSPARPPRLGSSRRCRARRGSRRAEGTREELEMGWNGTKGAPPGERVTGRWNWNWILSRLRAHAFFAGLLLFQPFFSTPRRWVESSGGLACRGAGAVAPPCSAFFFDFPPQIVAEPWLSN